MVLTVLVGTDQYQNEYNVVGVIYYNVEVTSIPSISEVEYGSTIGLCSD